jgi:hypothetical protein
MGSTLQQEITIQNNVQNITNKVKTKTKGEFDEKVSFTFIRNYDCI